MEEKGFTSILFILIILVISVGIIGGAFYIKQSNLFNNQPQNSMSIIQTPKPTQLPSLAPLPIKSMEQNQTSTSTELNNEVRFTGIITDTNNSCWADGVCSVKIDNSWIEVERGGLRPPNMVEEPGGQLIGISFDLDTGKYIGQKAEFYGVEKGNGSFTIYGNFNYYLKLLK